MRCLGGYHEFIEDDDVCAAVMPPPLVAGPVAFNASAGRMLLTSLGETWRGYAAACIHCRGVAPRSACPCFGVTSCND